MEAPGRTDATELIERQDEEAAIEAAVVAAAREGAGSLVLIEGPAGIGKTELVRAARAGAERAELSVAVARGSELERELAFGVVRQLLEPAVAAAGPDDDAELFAGAAALAKPLFSPEPATSEPSSDQTFAMLHGLYWLCATLSQRRPLLLAVDDAHWADPASLQFLAYLAQRREELPLALVVAARPAETPADEGVLAKLASDPLAAVVNPAPLSGEGVAELVRRALGRDPQPGFVDACRVATGGTPFLVRELARELEARGLEPVDESAAFVENLGPRTIARALVARMRESATGAVELAHSAAVLGRDADARRVALLADLDPGERVLATLDGLARLGVLSAGQPIEFLHPIIRTAVYEEIPAGERARLHGRAAQLLEQDGLPHERIASHLLSTFPSGDPWAVELLLESGRVALAQGAPASAIAYLQRAMAEPPQGERLVDVLHDLGHAEAADGRGTAGLRRALATCSDRGRRVRIGLDLARAVGSAGPLNQVVDAFEDVLADVEDPDSALGRELEAELLMFALNYWEGLEVIRPRLRRRLEQLRAGELDDPALLAPLAVALAASRPPAAHGAHVAERAGPPSFEVNSLLPGYANTFLFAGRYERAGEVYDRAIADARSRGSRLLLAWTSAFRGNVSLHQGFVARAVEETRVGYEVLREVPGAAESWGLAWSAAYLVEALLARGDLDEAAEVNDATEGWLGGPSYPQGALIGARGRLRLAQRRAEEALEDALTSALPNPRANPAMRPWRSDASHALRTLGRLEEARAYADEELALAREYDVPESIATALRARAASDDDGAEIALLEEAVGAVDGSEARLELAHALVGLGAALRRGRERTACRDALRRGLDLAERCGAAGLAEHAHAELLAAGARPRRLVLSGVEALTPSELRVAEMAAGGMTNREIAQALFVTGRTVETHLTHAYQKLDIASRDQLPEALKTPPE